MSSTSTPRKPSSPQISTVFSAQILEDFGMNETIRAGSSSSSASNDREQLCQNAGSNKLNLMNNFWAKRKLYSGLILILLLFLIALGMLIRHLGQQGHVDAQSKQIKEHQGTINILKELIEMHKRKLDALSGNGSQSWFPEHIEIQKSLLELHERNNQTVMSTLNQSMVDLEKCYGRIEKMQQEMWKMRSEEYRLKRRDESMMKTINETEEHVEVQKKMIEMMKDDKEEQQRKIETAKGDLEKSAEEMQMKEEELGKWKETVDQMNGTIQSLEAQMEVLNGTLELKDGIINSNEEHLKLLRVLNDSMLAHKERGMALENQLDSMQKQVDNCNRLLNSETRISENLGKQLMTENERREEVIKQLTEIKDGTCYRTNCRSN